MLMRPLSGCEFETPVLSDINDNIDLNRVIAFTFKVIYLICLDDNLTNFNDVIFRRDQSCDGNASPCVNFTKIIYTAFTLVDPKSVKNIVKSSVSFYTFKTCGCKKL